MIHRSSRQERITSLLRDLHWLRSPERIDYKLAVLVFMPERSRSKIPLQPHPTCCRVQLTLPLFIVIIVVSDPTNTTCHCRRPCFSGRRKSCLEQSATRRHISFNSRCFPKAPQNISVLTFIHCLILIHLCTVK